MSAPSAIRLAAISIAIAMMIASQGGSSVGLERSLLRDLLAGPDVSGLGLEWVETIGDLARTLGAIDDGQRRLASAAADFERDLRQAHGHLSDTDPLPGVPGVMEISRLAAAR